MRTFYQMQDHQVAIVPVKQSWRFKDRPHLLRRINSLERTYVSFGISMTAPHLLLPQQRFLNCLHWFLHDMATSSTAQGGGGSFKNRKPIGEIGCCESGMAGRIHWWTERCLRSPLFLSLSLSFSDYLLTYQHASMYLSIFRSIYLSLSLFLSFISLPIYLSTFYLSTYLPIYLSTYLPMYLSTYLSIYLSIYLSLSLSLSSVYLSSCLPVCLSICLSVYLSICGAVSFSDM